MSKKIYLPVFLLVLFAMALGACAPAAEPTTEAPVVQEPVATEVVPTEAPAPTEAPVVEELDFVSIFADLIANNPKEKGYGTIGAEALNTALIDNPDLFVLDVREPAEYEADGYIEGAVAIPLRQLMDNLDKLPDLDTPIVVYCKSGHRGAFAMDALQLVGYTDVRNLGGGIGAWKKAEYPVVMEVPAEPETISTPIVENEALFNAVHDFIANLPDGFYATSATAVNDMLINAETFTLVDVRRADEYESGYIETAVNIPLEELMSSLDQLPDKDAKIVIYCGSGHRGAMAAQALIMNGYSDVVNVGGGIGAWKAAELPLVGAAPDVKALYSQLIANNPKEKAYGTISAEALNTELIENPDLFVLDVRQPAEYETDGYIEGAVAVPIRELLDNLDKLPDLDSPIVVYCKSGHRGAFAMDALQLLGYTDVRNLGGGIGAWKKAEYPVLMEVPPEPESISTPMIADQALFDIVNNFIVNLPDGFYATSASAVNEMLINGETFTLVDVRRADEYENGYIETAINIPLEELMSSLDQLPDKEARIVIYCGSGHRGAMATEALIQNGYTDVVNMGGGIGAWNAAELPLVTD